MKRLLCALLILLLILSISVFSLLDMKNAVSSLSLEAETLRKEAKELSLPDLTERCRALSERWETLEKRFMLYVPHDHLDPIMEHLVELSAFAEHGEYPELFSNLDAVSCMMKYLLESVTPSYRTLL